MHEIPLKQKAIELRKQGLSYSEILKQVSVAKSTLSLWLQDVGLAKKQRQRLSERKRLSALRGGQSRKDDRIRRTAQIHSEALKELNTVTKQDIWFMGIALYWAEGAKEKEGYTGTGISFSNSDFRMIALFILWLKQICLVESSRIRFEIYIHENNKHRLPEVKAHWAKATGFPLEDFNAIYFKRDKPKTKRKNIGNLYFGVLRVKVSASSNLNRKVAGWVHAICKHCGVV